MEENGFTETMNPVVYTITVKLCEYCDNTFEVKEGTKWRKCCSRCYFANKKLFERQRQNAFLYSFCVVYVCWSSV
jgi:hypothetical protein